MKIRRALISVTDKTDLDKLATSLKGVELVSTGGTAKYLRDRGFETTSIESVSGNPEAFGGRMKTISFNVLSALLYKRGLDDQEASQLNIEAIDLVVCNLYPFEKKLKESVDFSELIENIDVGGPTMMRAAAKNYKDVIVLSDPQDYGTFIKKIESDSLDLDFSKEMAAKAFALTGHYDQMIARTFRGGSERTLRYGENPEQKARVEFERNDKGFATVEQLWGKEMSYNNYLDTDAALKTILDLRLVANIKSAVIVKHLNPCGAAMGARALEKAWDSDPISSFGGIVALSHPCDLGDAKFLSERFVEIIVAPSFDKEAQELLQKKKNLRLLLVNYDLLSGDELQVRSVLGGKLIQDSDRIDDEKFDWVTNCKPTVSNKLLHFGVVLGKHFKSNAIALVGEKGGSFFLAGAGMGNPNRIVSIEQAALKARANGYKGLEDLILVSDGFFPFADSIDLAFEVGVKVIVQPGGSIKDKEVIKRCDEMGIAMALTGVRHFNH